MQRIDGYVRICMRIFLDEFVSFGYEYQKRNLSYYINLSQALIFYFKKENKLINLYYTFNEGKLEKEQCHVQISCQLERFSEPNKD